MATLEVVRIEDTTDVDKLIEEKKGEGKIPNTFSNLVDGNYISFRYETDEFVSMAPSPPLDRVKMLEERLSNIEVSMVSMTTKVSPMAE